MKNNQKKKNPVFFKKNLLRKPIPKDQKDKKTAAKDDSLTEEIRIKKLEEFYKQGCREYINLFRGCPVALVYTNIDGIIQQVNRYFEELTGFSESEVKGNSLVYCLRPDDPLYFETDYVRTSFETTIYTKDNYEIQVLGGKGFNRIENRLAGMIFSFQNVSFLKRERRLKHVLFRISQIAHSELTLSEIYPIVQEHLKRVLVASNFYIALWNKEKNRLDFPYYTDEAAGDNEIFIQRYCTSQSIFHYILKNGKPVLMDFQRYRKMLSYGYIEPWDVMTNTHLWLAVPLKIEKTTIGVLALQSYDNARLYSEKDIDLLEFVAQQLASAIFRKSIK